MIYDYEIYFKNTLINNYKIYTVFVTVYCI